MTHHNTAWEPIARPATMARIMKANQPRRYLLSTPLAGFVEYCQERELPVYRAKQVYQWVYEKGATRFDEMTNLSKPLRTGLAEDWSIYMGQEVRRQVARDGTTKLLLRWADDNTSECVLIPDGKRQTACISSQVGCPVGCTFCASGVGGLKRNLTVGQIVEQAMCVRQLDLELRLTNVVFMGLGEPLANYDNVLAAVRIINADWGMNIGARKITISTVGMPNPIRKLAKEQLQIGLAISLHAPTDKLRRELVPWARKIAIDDIVEAGRYFFDTTGREITIEYVLLAGVNDKLDHANKLVTLCRRMRCNVNLIRYNPVADLGFERPKSSDAHLFAERLRERGVNVHVRKSRGLDIDAACGQLRRRHQNAE